MIDSGSKLHREGKFSFQINKLEYQLSKGLHFLKFDSREFTKVIKLSIF